MKLLTVYTEKDGTWFFIIWENEAILNAGEQATGETKNVEIE